MQLTEAQIERLYRFTREHFVEHYDVQTELVDHLANDIETMMEENPNLSFKEGLNKAFKKFGVFGFQDVITSKMKAMERKYWKLVLGMLKQFFTVPRILVSFTVFVFVLLLFKIFDARIVYFTAGFSGIVLMVLKGIQIKRIYKKRRKETGRKWLLEDFVLNMGGFILFMNVLFQVVVYAPENLSSILELISAVVLTIFGLLVYIVSFVLPDQIEALLDSQYPEYKLVY